MRVHESRVHVACRERRVAEHSDEEAQIRGQSLDACRFEDIDRVGDRPSLARGNTRTSGRIESLGATVAPTQI